MKDLMHIQIDARELAKALRNLSLAGQDMTPLMRALAETLKTETDLNFEDEGHPAWQPSVAALARKGMTLSASGQLRGSVTTDYSSHHAALGSHLDYARIHQLGGKAGRQRRVTLPARPYLPVDEQGALQPGTEQKLLDTVLRYLERATRR
ncbi:phage virion morphogenesis protein [Arsenophonus nasoniae]|uniref:Phage virion morphogenesis protein n=1 Tax=Arsenophonus nasoniae TaxID=638 RepID=A0ABY8NPU4_9GAMM|nr:phage virion morphogenesis protein [Arsenophonus nasoniae]WGM05976.1 phage virion morphogenesis protein [Arsenophonus nasoniae]